MVKPIKVLTLTFLFAALLIGAQTTLPLNARGEQIELVDSKIYFQILIIVGLLVGLFLPRSPREVWLGSFLGHTTYTMTIWALNGEVSNIWPLSLIWGALASLIPLGFVFLSYYVYKLLGIFSRE